MLGISLAPSQKTCADPPGARKAVMMTASMEESFLALPSVILLDFVFIGSAVVDD
jgi:hypothetical protein